MTTKHIPKSPNSMSVALRHTAIAALVLAGALLLIATIDRARVWHDSVTLWTSVIEYDDTVARAWNSRGAALGEAGQDAAALRDFTAALTLEPCYQGALQNRYLLAVRHGDMNLAARDRATAIDCRNRGIRGRRQ